ncbi:MAG: hypothetical protein AAGA17_01910 [Actinomycetota bacterium]
MLTRRVGPLVIVGLLVVLGLLAGCSGGGDDEERSPAPRSAAVWSGTLADGSTLTVELGVPADDRRVAPFEALRELGSPPVTWLVGSLEVPTGADEASGRFVTLVEPGAAVDDDDPFDAGDGVVSASFACSRLDAWWEAAGPETDRDRLFEGLFAKNCGRQPLQVPAVPGSVTQYVMVIDGDDLPSIERVLAGLDVELSPVP